MSPGRGGPGRDAHPPESPLRGPPEDEVKAASTGPVKEPWPVPVQAQAQAQARELVRRQAREPERELPLVPERERGLPPAGRPEQVPAQVERVFEW